MYIYIHTYSSPKIELQKETVGRSLGILCTRLESPRSAPSRGKFRGTWSGTCAWYRGEAWGLELQVPDWGSAQGFKGGGGVSVEVVLVMQEFLPSTTPKPHGYRVRMLQPPETRKCLKHGLRVGGLLGGETGAAGLHWRRRDCPYNGRL